MRAHYILRCHSAVALVVAEAGRRAAQPFELLPLLRAQLRQPLVRPVVRHRAGAVHLSVYGSESCG